MSITAALLLHQPDTSLFFCTLLINSLIRCGCKLLDHYFRYFTCPFGRLRMLRSAGRLCEKVITARNRAYSAVHLLLTRVSITACVYTLITSALNDLVDCMFGNRHDEEGLVEEERDNSVCLSNSSLSYRAGVSGVAAYLR